MKMSEENKLFNEYSELLNKYRNLLTAKILEKSEQIKNEFTTFAKVNGLNIKPVPDALEAYEGEKIKLKLIFMIPQPERAQGSLSIFFTSPKEFYLNIAHTTEPVKVFAGKDPTVADLRQMKDLYEDLQMSDVYISCIDKDLLTDTGTETKYSNFIDIIEELYKEPRKF